MNNTDNRSGSRSIEDQRLTWESWRTKNAKTHHYYDTLSSVNDAFRSKLRGVSPFTTEGIQEIFKNPELKRQYSSMLSREMFRNDKEMAETFESALDNSTPHILDPLDKGGAYSAEGILGAGNVYASSMSVFGHTGVLPFVIASYVFTCRSSEIYQIFNGKSAQLDFSYNVDVIQKDGKDYILPFAYRDGSIRGFNVLPSIRLLNTYTDADATGADPFKMYIVKGAALDNTDPRSDALRFVDNRIKCNVFEEFNDGTADGWKYATNINGGLDPGSLAITGIIYQAEEDVSGEATAQKNDNTSVLIPMFVRPTQFIERPNQRMFRFKHVITVKGNEFDTNHKYAKREISIVGIVNLDSGDVDFYKGEEPVPSVDPQEVEKTDSVGVNRVIGIKFEAKIQNIANEMSTATFYTRRQECVRETTYRHYATAGLNEYMQDNFFIGKDSGTNYPAYATDHILEATMAVREIEAEDMLVEKLNMTDDETALDEKLYPFSPKVGGFVDKDATFSIREFTAGISVQEYKNAVREFMIERLSFSDTYLNINQDTQHEWVLLANNLLANKLIVSKFESGVTNTEADGSSNPFGYRIDTRAGFVDNLDRRIRVIANTDKRWYADHPNSIYGAIKTHNMNMPFFVYYPYSVRMFQGIDANFPNRSSIIVTGRDLRDCWTAGLFKMNVEGAMDEHAKSANVFSSQMANSKEFNINGLSGNAEATPLYVKDVAAGGP